jgi:protein SCO1
MLRFLTVLFLSISLCPPLWALKDPGAELKPVGVSTKLGTKIDLSLPFVDSTGTALTLGQLFTGNRPVIIVPAYYDCPRLCGLILDGVRDVINDLTLELGSDYRVVTFSFDASETPVQAAQRAVSLRKQLSNQAGAAHWSFLVGPQTSIDTLLDQIGFNVTPDQGEFAHSAAVMVLTPSGEISQYFTGVTFSAWDAKLALVEASRGAIGSPIDHVMLFCFRFDPTKGKYTWAAFNIMRAGGALTLILLAGLIIGLWRRERRRQLPLVSNLNS